MRFLFWFGSGNNEQYTLITQLDTHPVPINLPVNIM